MSRNETEKRGRECGVHKITKYINHQRTATSHHTLQLSTKMVVAAQPPAGTTAQSPVRSGYTKDQTVGSDAIAMSWLPRYPALDSNRKKMEDVVAITTGPAPWTGSALAVATFLPTTSSPPCTCRHVPAGHAHVSLLENAKKEGDIHEFHHG